MRIHKRRLIQLFALLAILGAGCSSGSLQERADQLECQQNESCILTGKLSIFRGAPASVASLEYNDKCIALSLPEDIYSELKKWNGKFVEIQGDTLLQPIGNDITSYKLRDRWVAAGICETGLTVYVERIKKLN